LITHLQDGGIFEIWDTIPRRHVARHGFPEQITLQRVAAWWRRSLSALRTATTA
jgi:hypothetical protein